MWQNEVDWTGEMEVWTIPVKVASNKHPVIEHLSGFEIQFGCPKPATAD